MKAVREVAFFVVGCTIKKRLAAILLSMAAALETIHIPLLHPTAVAFNKKRVSNCFASSR